VSWATLSTPMPTRGRWRPHRLALRCCLCRLCLCVWSVKFVLRCALT
jgi:hypothetical protein